MLKKTCFAREVLFLFNFCFFMLEFSEGIDTHVSLPCFFSICAIAPMKYNLAPDSALHLAPYSASYWKI